MYGKVDQRAFTLTEVVVVITILAILAAFAVPRFTRMESQARLASAQALAGSIRSTAALAHALWLASGQPANVRMEGRPVPIVMVNGYPSRATIDDTLTDLTGFTYNAGNGVFHRTGFANCSVTYTNAPANGSPEIAIEATAANC